MRKAWVRTGKTAFWVTWPALFAYLYFSKRTRVIIRYKDEVLFVKSWFGAGKWTLPGGGLHLREDTVLGALREVKEETGINLNPEHINLLGKYRVRDHGLSSHNVLYAAELLERPNLRRQKLELLDIRWIRADVATNSHDISASSKQLVRAWRELSQPAKMRSG